MKKIFLIGLFLLMFSNIFSQVTKTAGIVPTDYNNKTSGVILYYPDTTTTPWTFHPVTATDGLPVMQVDSSGNYIAAATGAAYDSNLVADRVAVINGVQFHYTAGNAILDAINLDTDSVNVVFDMNSYLYMSLDVIISGGVTLKVFRTNNPSASDTNPYDGNWISYSTTFLGAASVADVTANYERATAMTAEKVLCNLVTSDASNSYTLRDKRSH